MASTVRLYYFCGKWKDIFWFIMRRGSSASLCIGGAREMIWRHCTLLSRASRNLTTYLRYAWWSPANDTATKPIRTAVRCELFWRDFCLFSSVSCGLRSRCTTSCQANFALAKTREDLDTCPWKTLGKTRQRCFWPNRNSVSETSNLSMKNQKFLAFFLDPIQFSHQIKLIWKELAQLIWVDFNFWS